MASKQPFKLFNITQKLTTWGIRINKFFKHRVLSKRKNALLIGGDNTQFRQVLTKKLAKTWQVYQVNQTNINREMINEAQTQKQKKQPQSTNKINQQKQLQIAQDGSSKQISILSLENHKLLQEQLKGRQYDAIIVLPQNLSQKDINYPNLYDQSIATSFIPDFEKKIMKNLIAYRLANKYLTTSGSFILSCSENDFLKKVKKQQTSKEKKQIEETGAQYKQEPKVLDIPTSKNIIDNAICYLGVVVGDRDYTDLNSWSLVGLSQQVCNQDIEFCSQFYRNWADGQSLPMPGSFALFKRNPQNKSKCQYVEYL